MKNKIKLIGVTTLTALIVFSMAACKSEAEKNEETLQGTWKGTENGKSEIITVTFSGDKFTMTQANEPTKVEGTFKIDGTKLKVTYTDDTTHSQDIGFTISKDRKTLTLAIPNEDGKDNTIITLKKS